MQRSPSGLPSSAQAAGAPFADIPLVSNARASVPPPGWETAQGAAQEKQPSPGGDGVTRRRLTARRPLIFFVAIALVAAAGTAFALTRPNASPQQSLRPTSLRQLLRGAGFTTEYPAGWRLTVNRPVAGLTSYALGSSSGKLNGLNIPAPGEVGITVTEYSLAKFARLADPAAPAQSALTLLPHVIGIPRSAQSPAVLTPLHATTLGGVPAASVTWSYTYNGVGNLQSDVVARRAGAIVAIEMDAEPALASRAHGAMATALQQWRWQRPGLTSSATQTGSHTAGIAGFYNVVGKIISSYGLSGERPGGVLTRDWSIRRSCTGPACRFILIRDIAAVSGGGPVTGVLEPAHGGWTAHFTTTYVTNGGCARPGSPSHSTEHSTWRLWATPTGLEAIEHGQTASNDSCAGSGAVIHWYATRLSGGA